MAGPIVDLEVPGDSHMDIVAGWVVHRSRTMAEADILHQHQHQDTADLGNYGLVVDLGLGRETKNANQRMLWP